MGYGAPKTLWAEYLYDSQLAGYYTTWHKTNFTFLTVHNAGHEVPAYQPVVALDMWNKYLAGEWW